MRELRILVCLPDGIGDAVMCTPALDLLAGQLPTARRTLVGPPVVTPLFHGDPRFAAVVTDATEGQSFRYLRLARLGRAVGAESGPFDLAFSFHRSLPSRWFMLAAGARRRIGVR